MFANIISQEFFFVHEYLKNSYETLLKNVLKK